MYPPLLKPEQFSRHFYYPLRMELFRPCEVKDNQVYTYQVKDLTSGDVKHINSLMLAMETEMFAFHDYRKIVDSLKYYDNDATFICKKINDFSKLYQ